MYGYTFQYYNIRYIIWYVPVKANQIALESKIGVNVDQEFERLIGIPINLSSSWKPHKHLLNAREWGVSGRQRPVSKYLTTAAEITLEQLCQRPGAVICYFKELVWLE